MSRLLELTEGWTGPLPFTLKADGNPVDLTGMTVELILTDTNGSQVNTAGLVTVTTATSGLVAYAPARTDLTASGSPFAVRFKVTDGSAKVVYFPNGQADQIEVHRP